jgi:hypothetical protein
MVIHLPKIDPDDRVRAIPGPLSSTPQTHEQQGVRRHAISGIPSAGIVEEQALRSTPTTVSPWTTSRRLVGKAPGCRFPRRERA